MKEALDVFKNNYDIYPLWICPYRMYDYSKSPMSLKTDG